MGSSFGRYLTVTTFGESHGPAVGAVIDGLPSGLAVDRELIQRDLDRRRPGQSRYTTARQETDQVEILSGLAEGKTLGSPVALLVRNKDARSKDYKAINNLYRPGHAEFSYRAKYGLPPQPGGGRASARETVGRVAAGALARALLAGQGVEIRAYAINIAGLQAKRIDPDFAEQHPLRFADPDLAEEAVGLVEAAMADRDSVGGQVEVVATGLPAGWGDPVFDKLDATLAQAVMSIGAVKAVEIGAGLAVSGRRGSENNDQMTSAGFSSNNAGGVLGGISTGQPIVVRLAVKPTPSIGLPQQTLNLDGQEEIIRTHGRHDPCICPRICPVAEAMVALALADAFLEQQARTGVTK